MLDQPTKEKARRIKLTFLRHRRNIGWRVFGKLRDLWGKWRESRRQYQLERALYKAGGNPTGPTGVQEHVSNTLRASGATHWRVEAPKSEAPDAREK
jgi:hypothetical protein